MKLIRMTSKTAKVLAERNFPLCLCTRFDPATDNVTAHTLTLSNGDTLYTVEFTPKEWQQLISQPRGQQCLASS